MLSVTINLMNDTDKQYKLQTNEEPRNKLH